MGFRKPSTDEARLIRALVARSAGLSLPPDWGGRLRVQEMSDGGMGSLRLSFADGDDGNRSLGEVAAELQFTDADGVEVIASLNADGDGVPFELDVWKSDFSALVRIPDPVPLGEAGS
ncbi:MAG TPA: hypothetical protein VE871_11715 [Longimicrobium sp.]|nr:hypothetical protein [Longimicrobium sp.]